MHRNQLFNPDGDTDVRSRMMIGGNTTNLNDFNNMKYSWAADWYRQAMNNFWIPEEINLTHDCKQYPELAESVRRAYDKILSFLVFLDSIQTANLPRIAEYITASEVNLCLSIQTYQECIHSQAYSYMLDSICSPEQRNAILYQWKTDEHLLRRNTFIGELYNEFQRQQDERTLLKVLMANYILEGVYFYSGFSFFYNCLRQGVMPGSAQNIRYINRDENTHLWLFRSIIRELQNEHPELFDEAMVAELQGMMAEGVRQEIEWGHYVIGDDVPGLNRQMITDYISYLGQERWTSLGYPAFDQAHADEPDSMSWVRQEIEWGHYVIGDDVPGLNRQMITDYISYLGQERWTSLGYPAFDQAHADEPDSMSWVRQYASANMLKTDFFEARSTAYAKSTALTDDL